MLAFLTKYLWDDDRGIDSNGIKILAAVVVGLASRYYYYRRKQLPVRAMTVGVIGAGSVGCIVGLSLARKGHKVILVGRSTLEDLAKSGSQLELVDATQNTCDCFQCVKSLDDIDDVPDKMAVVVTHQIKAVQSCDIILVAVKTPDLEAAAADLGLVLPKDANPTVFSLQNGLRSTQVLKKYLWKHKCVQVLSTVVGYNGKWVAVENDGTFKKSISTPQFKRTATFKRSTDGGLKLELPPKLPSFTTKSAIDTRDLHLSRVENLVAALTQANLPSHTTKDIASHQRAKIMVNLFNAVNALAGVSTVATFEQYGYRQVWSKAMQEALQVFRAYDMKIASMRGMPAFLLPLIAILPDALFWFVLRKMAKLDDSTRGSMLQDFELGRTKTEVDDLNGEIVRLSKEKEIVVPVNEALLNLVHEAEAMGASPKVTPEEMVVKVGLK